MITTSKLCAIQNDLDEIFKGVTTKRRRNITMAAIEMLQELIDNRLDGNRTQVLLPSHPEPMNIRVLDAITKAQHTSKGN